MKEKAEKPYGIRFPPSVLAAMKALAIQHDRSLNSEIVQAMRCYVFQQNRLNVTSVTSERQTGKSVLDNL